MQQTVIKKSFSQNLSNKIKQNKCKISQIITLARIIRHRQLTPTKKEAHKSAAKRAPIL